MQACHGAFGKERDYTGKRGDFSPGLPDRADLCDDLPVSRSAPPTEEAVTLEALVAELKVVIKAGLGRPRLDENKLPALKLVVARLDDQDPPDFAAQVERVVKPSVQRLGDSERGKAVALLFGITGASARQPRVGARRKLAADGFGVSADTFYRAYEGPICEVIAKDLLDRFWAAAPEGGQASDPGANGHDDQLVPATPRNRARETIAALDEPTAMALDPVERRLFVIERSSHRVVQVGLSDGSIAVVAGIGERGFSGDGADARLARFNRPDGLAFDHDRQLLYIADTDNHCVRRVHLPTSQITTVAGTRRLWPGSRDRSYLPIWPNGLQQGGRPATRAKLAFPRGLALSDDGTSLFISAPGSSSIRVLQPAKGFMRVLAGDGKVADTGDGRRPRGISFAVPVRLAFDANRRLLYVSQDASPAVRYFEVKESLCKVHTVPGTDLGVRPTNREQSFDVGLGHGGIALDESQQHLYVNASPGIACVRLPDGPRSMVAETDDLRFIGDMLFEPAENALYVSLRDQHRVVRIALS
jgi:DNA-binding beta-propeller fold protein YncE